MSTSITTNTLLQRCSDAPISKSLKPVFTTRKEGYVMENLEEFHRSTPLFLEHPLTEV